MLILVPYLLMFALELRYIIPVFIYTAQVKRRISMHTPTATTFSRAQVWLYLRFVGILMNQLIMWGSVITWDVKNILGIPVPLEHLYMIGISPLFLSLNGFIVLFGNRSLKEYTVQQIDKINVKWRAKYPAKNGELV